MALEAVTFINDFVVTNPVGSTDPKSQGDDHLRNIKTGVKNTLPGMAGRFARVQSQAAAYTVTANDNTTLINVTSAGVVITLTSAAALGNGFWLGIYNSSRAFITIDPAGTETINTYGTTEIYPNKLATIYSDGTNFIALNDIPQPCINPFINSDMQYWPNHDNVAINISDQENHVAMGYSVRSGAAGTQRAARVTATGAATILGLNPVHAIEIANSATATVTAGGYTAFKAYIEGKDFSQVALRPFGVSFAMRSSLTGTYNIRMRNSTSTQYYGRSFTISAANTWEYKTFRIPANAGTWDYSSSLAMEFAIILDNSPSANVIVSDQWTSVSGVVVAANVRFGNTASASCRITAINMWQGEDPYNWRPDSPGIREARESRLFQKSFPRDTKPTSNPLSASVTDFALSQTWPVGIVGSWAISGPPLRDFINATASLIALSAGALPIYAPDIAPLFRSAIIGVLISGFRVQTDTSATANTRVFFNYQIDNRYGFITT